MTETLDSFERDQLRRAERTIKRDLKAFVRCGEALLTIRDARLYRETHDTFEDYCRDRWQISKTHANRLAQAAAVMRELPADSAPTSERQARELATLLDDPGRMRRVWAKVIHRTGGKPTAKDVREVVTETIPHRTPADPGASADAPGRAGEGAPAAPGGVRAAGDTRTNEDAPAVGEHPLASNGGGTKPPATDRAGEGGTGAQEGEPVAGPARTEPPRAGEGGGPAAGPTPAEPGRAASGASDSQPLAESGAPTGPRPTPQPASPHAGPESGGTVAPSSSSQVDGVDGSPPSADPVAEGGEPYREPLLTAAEVHAALTDETSPLFLPDFGCRLALVHTHEGVPLDRAVVGAYRQSQGVAS